MRKALTPVAAVAAAALLAGTASAASISGTIKFEGTPPTLKPLAMDADPVCARKHSTAVANEMLVLGTGNTVANILVRVKGGLPAGKTYPAPTEPAVIDQNGCQYKPHVLAMMVGQKLKIKNSDGLLHNVHALPKVNTEFNRAMPATMTEFEHVFDKAEDVFRVKCDVHPWMGSYVAVLAHPFFAVTGTDGKFQIEGLPAGTYEIEAWHERLPAKTASVTVGADEKKSVDFTLSAPAR
jgi:plastocyanin